MCKQQEATERMIIAQRQLQQGIIYGALSLALLTMSFSLTLPHLQSRRDALGCDSMCLGSMTSARSTCSLIGSALMGRWSDSSALQSWGGARKLCLLVGSMASFAGLVVAANTYSLQGMWIAMIPGSLFEQNFSILKALFSDYHQAIALQESPVPSSSTSSKIMASTNSSHSDRAASVGFLGMAAGLAFMAGPLLGSAVLKTYEQATWAAMVCTFLSGILILQLPHAIRAPTTNKAETDVAAGSSNVWSFLNVSAARTPAAILFMTMRVSMALAFHIFQTIWITSLKVRFQFGPADHGKFMSFIGLTYALSQGFVAKRLLDRFGSGSNKDRVHVLLMCCILLGAGRYVAFQTTSLLAVYCMFAGIVTALGVVNTALTADTSHLATSDEIGGLFGILAAVESGAGMVGPILGGTLALADPIQAPLLAVVGLYAFVFVLVWWGYERFVLKHSTAKKAE